MPTYNEVINNTHKNRQVTKRLTFEAKTTPRASCAPPVTNPYKNKMKYK